jgi:hypothetical protein
MEGIDIDDWRASPEDDERGDERDGKRDDEARAMTHVS